MGWRKFLFDQLLVGADAKLSSTYYKEALAYTPEAGEKLLREAVERAVNNSPFYERTYAGFNLRDFQSLPCLTKKDIREHSDEMLLRGTDRSRLEKITTSGSTGYPVRVLRDQFGRESTRATEDFYFREFLGIEQAEVPSVVFWANSPSLFGQKRDRRKRFSLWLTRTSLLGATRFTPAEMQLAVETINWRKPTLLKGYTSTLLEVAKHVRKNNVHIFKPSLIVSLAETLHDHAREYIEETFECRIFDYYAAREVGPIAGQCTNGTMHLFDFHVHTEVVGADGSEIHEPGMEGSVLVTQLRNSAMPLIRYELGDMAKRAGLCKCGSALPGIERVMGRTIDYFAAEDGTMVYGGFFVRLLYSEPWIEEFTLLQKSLREIDISYVAAQPATVEQLETLRQKIAFAMGPYCVAKFMKVDSIPAPSGKRKYAESLCHNNLVK